MSRARYDDLGREYATTRREDPQLRSLILDALGDAASVVNVGAGAGSYEPRDRHVVPVEPSTVMIAQRPSGAAPAVRAWASALPLRDASVDAAMAVLTIHHWDEALHAGLDELRRVARGPVVIVTYDATVSARMWLVRDYLPELAALDRTIFASTDGLANALGGTMEVQVVPTSRDTPDWTLGSFWAHPERVLDETARNATSGLARMAPAVIDRLVQELRSDLDDGTWDRRHGHLRDLPELDVGMRLLVARP